MHLNQPTDTLSHAHPDLPVPVDIEAALPAFAEVLLPPLLQEELNPAWDLGAAAQHIVLTHFSELLGWRRGVWLNKDVEAVHQIRVSARRCRTALQTFAALWPDRQARRFCDYLARFADVFGTARDLDVMLIWLDEQLRHANGDRAAALRWLYDRNLEKRVAEQPRLERVLLKLEQDGFPAAFAAYFSSLPTDMWELSPAQDASIPELTDG